MFVASIVVVILVIAVLAIVLAIHEPHRYVTPHIYRIRRSTSYAARLGRRWTNKRG